MKRKAKATAMAMNVARNVPSPVPHSQQLGNDIASRLRWVEFPTNAKEILTQIDKMFYSCKSSNIAWNPAALTELVLQYVFNVYDVRDMTTSRLSTIQKLQLADMILTYLSYIQNDADRQAIFNTLFHKNDYYHGEIPLLIMSLVTSLAIASKNTSVLECIAIWMSGAGADSQAYIASDIIKDLTNDENPEKYDDLPLVAFLFTSLLLIAIGKAYRTKNPSPRLVKQVITWIESCPKVCFIPPQSAIFEIFRWCMNSEEDQSRLQFTLLNAIDKAGKGVQLQVIPHILTIIHELRMKMEKAIANDTNGASLLPYASVEKSSCRLFQLIQILISAECLEPNELGPIFETFEHARLPYCESYQLMKAFYSK